MSVDMCIPRLDPGRANVMEQIWPDPPRQGRLTLGHMHLWRCWRRRMLRTHPQAPASERVRHLRESDAHRTGRIDKYGIEEDPIANTPRHNPAVLTIPPSSHDGVVNLHCRSPYGQCLAQVPRLIKHDHRVVHAERRIDKPGQFHTDDHRFRRERDVRLNWPMNKMAIPGGTSKANVPKNRVALLNTGQHTGRPVVPVLEKAQPDLTSQRFLAGSPMHPMTNQRTPLYPQLANAGRSKCVISVHPLTQFDRHGFRTVGRGIGEPPGDTDLAYRLTSTRQAQCLEGFVGRMELQNTDMDIMV